MANRLYFRYGAMNSGKSTLLLQVAYNYEERGQHVVVAKPSVDTKGAGQIVSRLGATRAVDLLIDPRMNVLEIFKTLHAQQRIDCLLVDEAQFLTRAQVNQLMLITIECDMPVLAYGIRNDFQTNAFTGSARLLEIAHAIEELKTICRCGRKAIMNGRKVNGTFIREGSQVAIDGTDRVEYEALCVEDYLHEVGPLP